MATPASHVVPDNTTIRNGEPFASMRKTWKVPVESQVVSIKCPGVLIENKHASGMIYIRNEQEKWGELTTSQSVVNDDGNDPSFIEQTSRRR